MIHSHIWEDLSHLDDQSHSNVPIQTRLTMVWSDRIVKAAVLPPLTLSRVPHASKCFFFYTCICSWKFPKNENEWKWVFSIPRNSGNSQHLPILENLASLEILEIKTTAGPVQSLPRAWHPPHPSARHRHVSSSGYLWWPEQLFNAKEPNQKQRKLTFNSKLSVRGVKQPPPETLDLIISQIVSDTYHWCIVIGASLGLTRTLVFRLIRLIRFEILGLQTSIGDLLTALSRPGFPVGSTLGPMGQKPPQRATTDKYHSYW